MTALLFDLDGVLIDVTNSYRQAIKKTAQYFLKVDITSAIIQKYKNRGGLNNDWDLTLAIIQDRGLAIEREEVIAVFQQVYLGTHFNGLIANERLLVDTRILAAQNRHFKMGIVTGRPRQEALYTLERFNLKEFFPVVITMDDLPPGKGKPDPLGLQLAKQALNTTAGWYLGDTPDDMIAAQQAGLIPIGICGNDTHSPQRASLLTQSGATLILKTATSFFPCPVSPVSPVSPDRPVNPLKNKEQFT